ncbi:hypothetical protein JCM3765_001973 [Sporobolomyces pararoseus]
MTQLPFPPQSAYPPPLAYPAQPPDDHCRRATISSTDPSSVNGMGNTSNPSFQPSPSVPQSTTFPLHNPPYSSYPHQLDSYHSASSVPYQASSQSSAPIPPPRRSATLPSTPVAPQQPINPTTVITEDPRTAHHKSLVAYYWHYAQQGYSAPLTAAPGTEESLMQEKARKEAVDWARQCGMEVIEVEPQGELNRENRPRTSSRPLPVAPSISFPLAGTISASTVVPLSSSRPASLVGINGGRPLPAAPLVPTRSISLANPIHPTPPTSTPPHRSFSEAQTQNRSFSPASPSTTIPQIEGPAPERKRPLPAPPVVPSSPLVDNQLISQLGEITIPAPAPSPSPAPPRSPSPATIPTISFSNEEPVTVVPSPRSPSPHPAPSPAVPSFAINDEPAEVSTSSPAIPSFSFSVDDESAPSTAISERRAPPVHPRYDPSHPSHALYHPTSVASPLPNSSSHHASLPLSAEAGSIECTSCRQPIFGRVLMALSRNWHPSCFVCAEEGCGEKLEVMEFEGTPEDWDEDIQEEGGASEEKESLKGKAWCMVHFEERFALQCYHCHTPISSADYLPIHDPSLPPLKNDSNPSLASSNTRYYHPLHFFCAGCGDPFLDPVAYERSGEAIAKPYYVREKHPYCEQCDLRIWREKCPGCKLGLREEDGYVEIGNEGDGEEKKKWHEGCFKCSMCSKSLTGIYLLRSEPSTTTRNASDNSPPDEKPYCGECFDIVAKDEAITAVS